jgi:hypothetical protein
MAHPGNIGYCRAVGYGLNESCAEALRQQIIAPPSIAASVFPSRSKAAVEFILTQFF